MNFFRFFLTFIFTVLTANVVFADNDASSQYDAIFLEAVCQREAGRHDAAYDLLRRCVEIDSTKAEAFFYLAQYELTLKNREKSLDCFARAARLSPDNSIYQETYARALVNSQKFPLAISVLEQFLSKNRDRTDILSLLAHLYEQEEDYDNTIVTLNRWEEIEGKSERMSLAKSRIYTLKGDKQAAVDEMKTLADEYPNDLNYRGYYADILKANDKIDEAKAIYRQILDEEPLNAHAQTSLYALYKEQGDSVKADSMLIRMLTNKTMETVQKAYVMRGLIVENEQQHGDSTKVLRMFDVALSQPQSDASIAVLCATYMDLKRMPRDTVGHLLRKVIDIEPDNAAARLQLVGYAWNSELLDSVIALCNDARQYNPDEMAFYYYQGMAHYRKNEFDESLHTFQQGISVINEQSNPEIVSDFYAVMGDLLQRKGDVKAAFAAYDSCLQWKDDNIGCLNNYAYFLSVVGENLDKAEQMSFRTIKAEPKNPTYLDTYAWILFKQKRFAEAKIYIDQTLQCDTDTSAVMLEHAGDIYYNAGDKEKALELWREALRRAGQADRQNADEDRRKILTKKIKQRKYIKE